MPTLSNSRAAFLAELKELLPDELRRHAGVLDEFISWSEARPEQLAFRPEPRDQKTVSYCSTVDGRVIWCAYPSRQRAVKGVGRAKLALWPGQTLAGSTELPADVKAEVLAKLAGITGAPITADTKLDIPFIALKNERNRSVVKEVLLLLMDNVRAR